MRCSNLNPLASLHPSPEWITPRVNREVRLKADPHMEQKRQCPLVKTHTLIEVRERRLKSGLCWYSSEDQEAALAVWGTQRWQTLTTAVVRKQQTTNRHERTSSSQMALDGPLETINFSFSRTGELPALAKVSEQLA